MKSFLSRRLVIGVSVVVLLGCAAVGAVAATQGSAGPGRQAYLDDVAKRLGVSSGALTAAMKAAAVDLGFGGGRGARAGVARYLGISPAMLRSERQSGRSLAQIASSTPGRSVAGLKAAIIAAQKARLAAAVSHGRITVQQEQERLNALASRVEAMLQRSSPAGRPHGGMGFGAHGRG